MKLIPFITNPHSYRVLQLIIIILFIAFSGCEKKLKDFDSKKESVKQSVEGANTMQPRIYKGMYYFLSSEGNFFDCDTKKEYVLPESNENAGLKRVYTLITNGTDIEPGRKIYIEAEGFTSAQSNEKGKGLDSVLIVTKFVKLDTAIHCDK